jgi:transposase
MRPIQQRTADRVQAHIFVASLALLIHRAIEKKLKSAGLDLSATEALFALKSRRVAAILRARISPTKPPTPPQHDTTIL